VNMYWTISGHVAVVQDYCRRLFHYAWKKVILVEMTKSWNELLKDERLRHGWSQKDVADRIGSNTKAVSRWERGEIFPGPFNRQKLSEVYGKSIEVLGLIQKKTKIAHDEEQPALQRAWQEDWGEAPDVEPFYGRGEELGEINRWILDERCRLVTLLGIGGVGKTTLAIKAARQIQKTHPFAYVYWRSLQYAPSVESLLENCLQNLFQERPVNLSAGLDHQISLLTTCLRERRCLLILDNIESIFRAEQHAGQYLESYEGYGRLFQLIGETDHQSCLLLTGREKPREVARLEGVASPVRALRLSGMEQLSGQELLADKGLFGTGDMWQALVRRYAGNPLALKLVSEPVREVFGGDIAAFLREEEAVFGDIYDLLEQQFRRLSGIEREIVYWLAIERENVSLDALQKDLRHRVNRRTLLEALDSLRRRSIIEASGDGQFLLQPVILEYVTGKFVAQICTEIETETPALLGSHALMKAGAIDYVRNSQIRYILEPITQGLYTIFGKAGSERKLKRILTLLRARETLQNSYAAGNILNLLIQSRADLHGLDLSHLTVRQAYLQGISLLQVNFANANLETGTFTDTFSSILCLAVSPDGALLAGGTTTDEIRLWRVEGAMALLTCPGHTDGIRSVTFSPDCRMFASGSEDHTVRLWESNSGRCLNILKGHTDWVLSVAFSPDGQKLASSSVDRTVRLWDAGTGECIQILQGHSGWVRAVAFSPDGRLLASGSNDQTIRLWCTSTGECVRELTGHTGWVRTLAFSADGQKLASGSEDRSVRFWHIETGESLHVLLGHTDRVRTVAWIDNDTALVSGSDDRTMRFWDASTGECFRVLQGHTNRIWSLVFVPASKVLVSASEDDTMRFWDIRSGQCTRIVQGRTSLIKSVAFSPDGHKLASGSEDQLVRLWDVESGQCVKTLRKHGNRVRCVTFSPDGASFASGSEDETIRIWDTNSGACLKTLQGHTNLVRSLDYNADGRLIASGSNDQTVRIWDVDTGRCLKTIDGYSLIWSVAFSPDDSMLASGGDDRTVRLWDSGTGACISTLEGHTQRVWSVAFDPAGDKLASSSDDQTIRLWNASTGECLKILEGHTSWVRSVAFSADGQVIASGSHDRTVRIWDAISGQCLKVLRGHDNCVWSVAFNAIDGTLASVGDDGSIKLWDIRRGACLKTLRSARLYEGMNIANAKGLTDAQRASLRALGAVE
jgi:WD40 repeat protein/transcriptional regulator with XRE-family HTH domain